MDLRQPSAVKTRVWAISWRGLRLLGSGATGGGSCFLAGLTGAAAAISGLASLAGLGGGASGFFFLKKIMSRRIPFIKGLCQVLIRC